MTNFTIISLLLNGAAFFFSLAFFGLLSIREKEKRAARVSFSGAIPGAVFFLLAAGMPTSARVTILSMMGLLGFGLTVLFVLPIGNVNTLNDVPKNQFDERRIMFARAISKLVHPNMKAIIKTILKTN